MEEKLARFKAYTDPAKNLDRETNYYTQGFSDMYSQEANEMKGEVVRGDPKKVAKRQGYFKSKEANALLRMVKRNRLGLPFALLSSDVAGKGELEMVDAVYNQNLLNDQARENLQENAESAFDGMSKEERVLKKDTFMRDIGKHRADLLELTIAHRNVIEEVTKGRGEFHADFYDLLYHPKTGVYMKPEDQRTEFEKNFILGYSQNLPKLGKLDDVKFVKELIMKSDNFVKWWNLGNKPSAISVERGGAIIPKLVHHGTLSSVSPLIGFWDRPMGMDADVLAGLRNISDEPEKASNFGSIHQAVERLLDKQGDGSLQDYGRSKWDKLQNVVYSPKSGTKEAKFYSGFIKMNNPLRTRDLGGFDMDRILKYLSGDGGNKKSLMSNFTYSILSPGDTENPEEAEILADFNNDGTNFPLLVDHFGQGTALEQVLNYARQFYEEDMNKVGYSLEDWNQEWDVMSRGTRAAIHHYKMHGLIKFINKDLGYDGIVYENTNEDARVDSQGIPEVSFESKTKEERVKLFDELAVLQRGGPEVQMLKVQSLTGGGVLNMAVEHGGDLVNRMAKTFHQGGYEYAEDKIWKVHDVVTQGYGFEKELLENLKWYAKEKLNIPFDKALGNLKVELKKFAEEHKKLPVYNEAHRTFRDFNVAIGEWRFDDAKKIITKLKNKVNEGSKAWNKWALEGLDPEDDPFKTDEHDSYILFHPWQFKSMYNNGDFKWGRRNFLGKTNGKNKYKKKEQVA